MVPSTTDIAVVQTDAPSFAATPFSVYFRLLETFSLLGSLATSASVYPFIAASKQARSQSLLAAAPAAPVPAALTRAEPAAPACAADVPAVPLAAATAGAPAVVVLALPGRPATAADGLGAAAPADVVAPVAGRAALPGVGVWAVPGLGEALSAAARAVVGVFDSFVAASAHAENESAAIKVRAADRRTKHLSCGSRMIGQVREFF